VWIKNVELENVGKHRHLVLDLPKGLIGVFGPNGCGKSTVTDSIYAALTNDWSRFDGVKVENICDMAEEHDRSMIHVTVEHQDTEFTIVRSLRPNRSELHLPDQDVITKTPEIQEELEKRLGISSALMDSHVFVGQWHMFAFLSQQKGERAKAFQRLCRTEKAAEVYKAAGIMLDSEVAPGEIIDNSDELRAAIGKNEKARTKATTKKESLQAKLLDHEKKMKARRFIARFERVKQIDKELEEAREEEVDQRGERNEADGRLESLTTREESLEERVAQIKPKAKRARKALDQFKQFQANRASRESFTASIGILEEALSDLVKPKKPKGVSQEERFQKERATKEVKITQYSSALQKFDEDGEVECPTCGTLVSDMDDHLSHMRETLPGLRERVTELSSMLKAIGAWRIARTRWSAEKTKLEGKLETAQSRLADLEELDEPDGDEDELLEIVRK
jgi:DNA repair exonuclease SbcCD ATPase subunit